MVFPPTDTVFEPFPLLELPPLELPPLELPPPEPPLELPETPLLLPPELPLELVVLFFADELPALFSDAPAVEESPFPCENTTFPSFSHLPSALTL